MPVNATVFKLCAICEKLASINLKRRTCSVYCAKQYRKLEQGDKIRLQIYIDNKNDCLNEKEKRLITEYENVDFFLSKTMKLHSLNFIRRIREQKQISKAKVFKIFIDEFGDF